MIIIEAFLIIFCLIYSTLAKNNFLILSFIYIFPLILFFSNELLSINFSINFNNFLKLKKNFKNTNSASTFSKFGLPSEEKW